MNELITLIDGFINEQIDLNTYIIKIKQYQITNKEEFTNYLESYTNDDKIDQRMNALLILWFYKHKYFIDINSLNNEYLSYIEEISENITDYKLDYLSIENNYLIIKLDDLYFIINHNNHLTKIPLPIELQYQKLYCLNCNDNMKLKENIVMPEFSFYVLEK